MSPQESHEGIVLTLLRGEGKEINTPLKLTIQYGARSGSRRGTLFPEEQNV